MSPILQLCAAVILAATACTGPRPPIQSQASLYRDLERHVTVADAAGWEIDRYEIEELVPMALPSTCRVDKTDRIATLHWIDAEIDRLGGPVERAYRERGNDLDEVEDLLTLTRIRRLLDETNARAETECPFWTEPDPNFDGLQLLDNSWVASFGGGGKAILFQQGDQGDVSAGGAGRLLLGRAFGPHWMLSIGGELGALAEFPRVEGEDRGALVLGLEFVAPLVVRYRMINSYAEVELGPYFQGREDRDELILGGHVGVSFGAQATRRLFVLPGGAFTIAYERTRATEEVGAMNIIKLGFRVAIDVPL